MKDIISQLTAGLGMESGVAEKGLGTLLGAVKEKAPAGDFDALLKAVPGASGWIDKASSAGGSGGGLLGKAAGMLGGGGGMAGLISKLGASGLDPSTAQKFIPLAIKLLKENAGEALFARLANSVPFLKEVGGSGLAAKLGGLAG